MQRYDFFCNFAKIFEFIVDFNIWLIILSLIFSAFFSGMEIAFVSSNKLRFELDKKSKSITSELVGIFYRHPQQYISTMLVGNNVSLVIFSIQMAQLLAPYLNIYITNELLLSLVQSVIATIIVLITGEFLPKTIFRRNPNLWIRIFAWPLFAIYIVLYPIALFCTWLSVSVVKIGGIKVNASATELTYSRADLNYLLQETIETEQDETRLEPEVKIFQKALDLSEVKLRDCYVPRTELAALPHDTDIDTLLHTFIETGHSKILIYKDDIDNIIGHIHSSELFEHKADWQEHIRPIPFVPENMAATRLMQMLLQKKRSMAVVVDEFGGTAGVVTLEDILEEIIGDIKDEHDSDEFTAKKLSDDEYLLSGRMPVDECNEQFDLGLPEDDDYETIAGLVLHESGRFPKVNETIEVGKFKFKCLKITDNRIEMVKLQL